MTLWDDVRCALGFLTRLPGGGPGRLSEAARAVPLVGVVIGTLQALVAGAALWCGVPATVAAGLALLAGIMATGGLHEDGLADTADGLWGGASRDRRLEIMRDSRVGSYGVLALILILLLQAAALAALFEAGWIWGPLVAAGAASRAAMIAAMSALPHARRDGLAHMSGRPDGARAVQALAIAAAVCLLAVGAMSVWVVLVAAGLSVALARVATSRIGGQTGDILGATQLLVQTGTLIALSAGV